MIYINVKRVLNLILNTDKKFIFINIISSIILSLLPLMSLNLMQYIVNMIQLEVKNIKHIFYVVFIYLIINLFEYMFSLVLEYYNNKFEMKFNLRIQNLILLKSSKIELKNFEDSEVYNKFTRAQEYSNGKIISIINTSIQLFTSTLTCLLYIMKFIVFNIYMIPFVVIIPIIRFKVINRINKKQYDVIIDRSNDERKSWYYNYIMTNGDAFKELKINNLFPYFIKKYNLYINKFNKQDLSILLERLKKMSILEIFEQIIDGILFSIIIYFGILKVILIGDVVTYTKLIMNIKDNIKNILNSISTIKENSLYINMLFELLDLKEEKENTSNKKEFIKVESINSIELKHVFFKYKSEQDYILKNINLRLDKNTSTAIVGLNGSGKTTLAKLIMGYYKDYEGEILINGIELRKIDIDSYRRKLGFLFQDFLKYEATLRENICYGNLKMMNKDLYLKNILKEFKLEEITNKTIGLETQLGYWFDTGKQISLGQWHRVALARTFLKDAEVYLLDEPNASLDPIIENELSKKFSELFENKIGIIITHRFINVVKNVDNIVVIDKGIIAEEGNHNLLLKNNYLYKKLYNLQLEGE